MQYLPEGKLFQTAQNQAILGSIEKMRQAKDDGTIVEARATVCDAQHNLIVELGDIRGIIPKNEGALGIAEGTTRDIALISRVNKIVCFIITDISQDENGRPVVLLSRRKAQQRCAQVYIHNLRPGDVIDTVVSHLEPFGCFVDIGCGIASLIPIDAISVSRISHPADRFCIGQDLKAIVKSIDSEYRISLTHKELLGTWEENARNFSAGETVIGTVRSVEPYGIFVELAPNLAGLAERKEGVRVGQQASVYIKSLIPEKMKIKLIIVNATDACQPPPTTPYFFTGAHMDSWIYSPTESQKRIESRFI